MFEKALLVDSRGRPIQQHHRTHSTDWDEVRHFCRSVYMPYRVQPLGRFSRPNATMYSARIGRITVTRFCYGVPIHLDQFDAAAGNILVLTTIRGGLRHMVERDATATTLCGESFVADCSRTEYWLDGDEDHLQINLTIPHGIMEDAAHRFFGFVPDDRLWRARIKFGGEGSAWLALLEYAIRSIAEAPDQMQDDRIGAHVEEAICFQLLRNWAHGAGVDLTGGARMAAPGYVRAAEDYMERHALAAPTMGEVAAAAGVSVRALTGAFRRFRNTTPGAFLRERRLQGARDALAAASPGETVSAVASRWGYVNFGIFARSYRERFGELPSRTLGRARRG
ncbi:MAG TPA: helix-turn-helix transcriptional regulator [Rhodoblastus sp.]|nr:helix-turn-helix transcriptional regulator [Rhodoblastus sp.]